MLEIRYQVIRRPTGVSFNVWILHDGLVKVDQGLREQCGRPAVVLTGVPSRRALYPVKGRLRPIEDHVVLLERVHGDVVHRADGRVWR